MKISLKKVSQKCQKIHQKKLGLAKMLRKSLEIIFTFRPSVKFGKKINFLVLPLCLFID